MSDRKYFYSAKAWFVFFDAIDSGCCGEKAWAVLRTQYRRLCLHGTLSNFYLTDHAGFHVSRKEAGKVYGSSLRKLPDEPTFLTRIDRDHIGLGMCHSRHVFHHGCMLFE